MRRSLFWFPFIYLVLLTLPVYGDGTSEKPASRRNLYLGFEQSELLQNGYRNLGINNFTFFVGQRFWFDGWEKLGWRFLTINVELSEEHLKNNIFIEGDKEGLKGRLNVQRIYIDYCLFDSKKGFFEFTPIVSAGLGYNYVYIVNTRNNESVQFGSISLPFAVRLAYTFWDIVFLEIPVGDFSIHHKMPKTKLGDTYINFPEHFTPFMWINLGLKFKF